MENNQFGWYSTESAKLSEIIGDQCSLVELEFDKALGKYYSFLIKIMDNSYRLKSYHLWLFQNSHLTELPKNSTVILAAIHKNFFLLHSALNLTRRGMYGPARTLLRQSFEFLVIAKFCSISEDSRIYGLWENGETIYFTRGVLNKIVKPEISELKDFWSLLSEFSHSTSSSQQTVIEWSGSETEIYLTLTFVHALVECQYHLLNSILITRNIRSFALRYANRVEITALRESNKILLAEIRRIAGKKTQKLIRCYCGRWEIS